ncbi:cysteine peptidase family C39 domain-containing protein [Paenibacillus sp. G2S3]|uniref:cysteine peptidase family C39 domain-containing protein n=1 Tax=Paenibacillus sp. G2S3 TaxID=3047872 RepID=UPI0032E3A073
MLNKLQAGDFFGELALLKGETRIATVRTLENATLFRLSKEDFDHLISEYPKIKEAILRISSNYSGSNLLDQKSEEFLEPPLEPSESISIVKSPIKGQIKSKPAKPWRRLPFILQQSEMDCGPTCISMICKYYGAAVPINYIKSNMQLSRSGTSLQDLQESARSLGFEAEGIRGTLANLTDIQLPAIAHWKGNHYIVVYRVTKKHVYVADPAIGVEKLTHEQFAEHWKGMLLTLTPTMALKESTSRGSTLQRYAAYLKPHKRVLGYILLLSIVIQLISLSLPMITQLVMDNVLVHRNEQLLMILMSTMLAISLVNGLFMFVRQWISSKTALQIDTNMVEAFYKHLLGLPLSFLMNVLWAIS